HRSAKLTGEFCAPMVLRPYESQKIEYRASSILLFRILSLPQDNIPQTLPDSRAPTREPATTCIRNVTWPRPNTVPRKNKKRIWARPNQSDGTLINTNFR